jgi:hypothetical protein
VEDSEEGQGPQRAVEPMMMMMMINKIKAETETGQPCDLTL